MYDAGEDPYCYPGTSVLRNLRSLRSLRRLHDYERAMTAQRAEEPLPSGRLTVSHYCAVHRHIFQDVYSWAGRPRTVRMAKGCSTFCYPENIEREMKRRFGQLRKERFFSKLDKGEFSIKAAHSFLPS